jgi:vacuolar-type H+-ATPase subunit F/Vma7
MRRRVAALAAPAVAAGLALSGVPTEAVEGERAAARFRELAADDSLGILLVDETIFDALPEELRASAARRPLPLVVPVPAPRLEPDRARAEEAVVELLRQAVGYRVRLR